MGFFGAWGRGRTAGDMEVENQADVYIYSIPNFFAVVVVVILSLYLCNLSSVLLIPIPLFLQHARVRISAHVLVSWCVVSGSAESGVHRTVCVCVCVKTVKGDILQRPDFLRVEFFEEGFGWVGRGVSREDVWLWLGC